MEKKYKLLLNIHRAAHFEWIRAVEKIYPDADLFALVEAYWEEVAVDTARAYLNVIDPQKPLAPQIAGLIVNSSLAMGEDAHYREEEGKSVVEHKGCPWWDWHKKERREDMDRPGCDMWFFKTVENINQALGSKVQLKTAEALPDGHQCCKRVFWVEEV